MFHTNSARNPKEQCWYCVYSVLNSWNRIRLEVGGLYSVFAYKWGRPGQMELFERQTKRDPEGGGACRGGRV